ncbi:sigma factor-like helix-turn-helix DNA-binding protein [Sphingomonas sp. S2-65]|uniref:sigma factor-like helix-turn-helix DNA-binding protein n=1 Tax=Sphingomonas sp. S2-65 TaxID=2903960 RepID=UPI001F44114D|nr:sigma factor-like helix-turn-helix DNA-binding protein [Sphingomonas sp. S2-65]UYY59711.1 sigma-70 family RNA polymerase sigma factor [Sphingomonas sp. S2-65]
MSKTTIALEAAVAVVLENTPKDAPRTNRQRVTVDRAFAQILKLIAPRIRHFVRQYGLVAHFDDAEQCCAIAVHRAIEAYDPAKAQFTTFVNWQIRGELQSLRFRLMTDQRPSAKKVEATTVSLSALATGPDGEEISPEAMLVDEDALERTEAAASDYLADGAISSLIDAYVDHLRKVGIEALARRPRPKRQEAALRREGPRLKTATHGIDPAELDKLEAKLERDREIVARRVFQASTLDDLSLETGVTKERVRQITKRAAKTIAEIAAADPRFAVMAESDRPAAKRRPAAAAPTASLLPDAGLPHNRLASVSAVEALEISASTIAAVTDTTDTMESVLGAGTILCKTALH